MTYFSAEGFVNQESALEVDRAARMSRIGDTATELRSFLEPLWLRRKAETGRLPDAGSPLSEGMCGFTSAFVVLALSVTDGPGWRMAGGWPQSGGGIACRRGRLHGHFWAVSEDGIVVDLTADQFGHPNVIVTTDRDARYVESFTLNEIERHAGRVMPLAEEWLALATKDGLVPHVARLAA